MAEQARSALAAGDESSAPPQYSPSREVDILHLALDITPDFSRRSIAGTAVIRFKPIARALAELGLDAEAMTIESVTATEPIRSWHYDDHRLRVTFDNGIAPDREATVTIRYRTEPTHGLYFRTPEMGYKAEDTHLWTQGEPIESRHWFPCFDAPNEKFTSEVTCRVPDGMVVRSNGRLVSSTPDPATGLTAVRWLQDKPHVTYLICLVAGKLVGIEDKHRDIPLAFYTPTSQAPFARNSFRDTRSMMEFFERELGVPYPWAKYDQIVVDDYSWGGMENTSITVLNAGTLFPDGHEPVTSSRSLVAHELAHQWFGDLVTCRDWSHLWLNEGFATYYEALHALDQLGRDEFLLDLRRNARGVLSTTDATPIVWRRYSKPEDQFGYRAYPKGAWVLHMLRSQLGPDLFRRCVTTYLQRHAFGVVETADLQKVVEELSGRSFDRFFDQWLYHGHHPELDIRFAWDEQTRLARITVNQTQKVGGTIPLFEFPLPVRFTTTAGTIDRTLDVRARNEDFHIPLPAAPTGLRIDPEYTVLARISFEPPTAFLEQQLRNTNDPIGRLIAVEALGRKEDRRSLDLLRDTLQKDPLHAVRVEAANALRTIHTDDAFEALKASLEQPDPRVRIAVLRALNGFHREALATLAPQVATRETHPEARIAAIRLLGNPSVPDGTRILTESLNLPSFRDSIASAALESLRRREDPTAVPAILAFIRDKAPTLPTDVQGDALEALGWLHRDADDKSTVRSYLASRTQDLRPRIRREAITALGNLGDPQAIPLLETFANGTRKGPEQAAASTALGRLRDRKRPASELGELRSELTRLQEENRDLKKKFEDLRKRLDALVPPGTGTTSTGKPTQKRVTAPPRSR